MGQYKTTLSTDDVSITLSLYEETDEAIPYERIIADVELELPSGATYSEHKEIENESVESNLNILTKLQRLLSERETAQGKILDSVLTETITKAEEDLGHTLELHPPELLHEFEQNTDIPVSV